MDQKTYLVKVDGKPKNQGVNPFSDPVSPFGAPLKPFLIFEVLMEGMVKSKNQLIRGSNNIRFDLFPYTVGHFGLSGR